MGMFDWVNLKYPLPEIPPNYRLENERAFQTKCGEMDLGIYTIDADGQLTYKSGWSDKTEERARDIEAEAKTFTGEMIIYCGCTELEDKASNLRLADFSVKFVNGKVVSFKFKQAS
jgi:hypothetical protein